MTSGGVQTIGAAREQAGVSEVRDIRTGPYVLSVAMGRGAIEGVDWSTYLDPFDVNAMIVDEHVDDLYGAGVRSVLEEHARVHVVRVRQGEAGKTVKEYKRVTAELAGLGAARRAVVISLGGAATNNLAGFVAATYGRGVRLVHIPTTVLAQLDGAVDVKQAVNAAKVKNLLGAMYSPALVVCDPRFLETLTVRQKANGLAEALKHALMQDRGLLRELGSPPDGLPTEFCWSAIRRTVHLKADILSDPDFADREILLQYGHAIGHALESASSYSILHGEAIAVGMALSARIAANLALSDDATAAFHRSLFEAYGLPVEVPDELIGQTIGFLGKDKYRLGGLQQLAFVSRPGEPSVTGEGTVTHRLPLSVIAGMVAGS